MKSPPCTKARVAMYLILLACFAVPRCATVFLQRAGGSHVSAKPAVAAEELTRSNGTGVAGLGSVAGRGTLHQSLAALRTHLPSVAASPQSSSNTPRPMLAIAPRREAQLQHPGSSDSGRLELGSRSWSSYVGAYVVLVLLCAVLYDSTRFSTAYAQPKGLDDAEAFKYGLFDCLYDWRLSLFSLLCCPLRWADTMDKAHDGTLIRYWPGVLILLLLVALNLYLGSAAASRSADPVIRVVVGIALLALLVAYRQKLRHRYDIIPAGDDCSYAEDALTWLFCPCCAAVQEARQVEANLVPMERHY